MEQREDYLSRSNLITVPSPQDPTQEERAFAQGEFLASPSFLLLLPSFLSLAQDCYAFQLGQEEQGEALLIPQIPNPA